MICPLSPAYLAALGAFQLFAVLLFIDVRLAPLPLILFICLCLLAPLFPRFSFYLPVTSRGKKGLNTVSLTFDDGPDPDVTPRVLELLHRHGISATFFVTGVRAERYPELIRDILAAGHTLGNHTYNHSPFVMLKGKRVLEREIREAQRVLQQFGVTPLAFRPPVGITSPSLWRILLETGLTCINFSRRPGDRGNRSIVRLGARMLKKILPGDIVLLHDVKPHSQSVDYLLGEFSELIEGLKGRGVDIVPLARLLGREIMLWNEPDSEPNPTRTFYDGLAAEYDEEQFCSQVSLSRRLEHDLFSAVLPKLLTGGERVMEIGAGTGIFTLDIARHCREVVAVDISANMLRLLEEKARNAGISTIRTMVADVEQAHPEGPFSVVFAFSALEYLTDLGGVLARLAPHVEPGGHLYVITARRSFFRFFTQLGNAMRQGIWLKARSRREMTAMLRAAGFEPVAMESHLLKSWFSGGMLLEVLAQRTSSTPMQDRDLMMGSRT